MPKISASKKSRRGLKGRWNCRKKRPRRDPGSARASRAPFGALAECALSGDANSEKRSSRWRGRHRQHARRVRSPESIRFVFFFDWLGAADFWLSFASLAPVRLLSFINFFENVGDHRRSRGAAVDLASNIAFVQGSERILRLVSR